MCSSFLSFAPIFLALVAIPVPILAQDPPRAGTYQIRSGEYTELGGIAGAFGVGMPYPAQAFVALNIDSGGRAQLSFLNQSQQSPFYIKLTNGVVSANTIQFQYWTTRPFGFDTNLTTRVDYVLTNAAGHLLINGAITSPVVCCDVTYWYGHSNLVATYVPTMALSFSNGVRVNWTSASNQNYQVQWAPDLFPSGWNNLGNVIPGNGTTNGVLDILDPASWQRFYRVLTDP